MSVSTMQRRTGAWVLCRSFASTWPLILQCCSLVLLLLLGSLIAHERGSRGSGKIHLFHAQDHVRSIHAEADNSSNQDSSTSSSSYRSKSSEAPPSMEQLADRAAELASELREDDSETARDTDDLAQTSSSMASRETALPDNCPTWMDDYAAFHKQHRGKPGAKYLVFSVCPGFGGLGDRIRGMLYVTRLAVSLQRVVLFTWRNEPHEPHWFLPPSGDIDWTLDGIIGYDYPQVDCSKGDYKPRPDTMFRLNSSSSGSPAIRLWNFKASDQPAKRWVKKGGLKTVSDQFITLVTNDRINEPCEGCPWVAHPMDTEEPEGDADNAATCLFHHLFKPSDELQAAVTKHRLELFGEASQQPGFSYVAMHLRVGGMPKERTLSINKGSDRGQLADLIEGLECAEALGSQVGMNSSQVPVLLLTDHHALRRFVRTGHLAHVVTTSIIPTHIARMDGSEKNDKESSISTYIDLALLAGARCFVASNSGFSTTAWMLGGGTDCIADLSKGLQGCRKDESQQDPSH